MKTQAAAAESAIKTKSGPGPKTKGAPTPPPAGGPAPATAVTEAIQQGFKQLAEQMAGMKAERDELAAKVSKLEEMLKSGQAPAGFVSSKPADVHQEAPDVDEMAARMKSVLDQGTDGIKRRLDILEAKGQLPGSLAENDNGWLGRYQGKNSAKLIHESEVFKQVWSRDHNQPIGANTVEIPSVTHPRLLRTERGLFKSDDPIASSELAALITPYYRPGIVTPPDEVIGFPGLIPRRDIDGATTHSFVRETEKSRLGYLRTKLAAPVVSGAGTAATFKEVEGFIEGETVRFYLSATSSVVTAVISSINATTKVVTFTATLNFNAAINDDVTSERYGATAELGRKPAGMVEFERVDTVIKTLAIMAGITQQQLNSIPQLLQFINTRMRYRAFRNLAWHLLYGDGTKTDQLYGFFTAPGVQTSLWSTGVVGDTRVDAILDAANLIDAMGPLVLVMNKRDWTSILKEKSSSDGHYLHSNRGAIGFINTPTVKAVGELIVRIDGAVKQGDYWLGDPSMASELADQNRSNFSTGFINTDYRDNVVRARFEEFLNHAILSVAYYVYGTLDSAPT